MRGARALALIVAIETEAHDTQFNASNMGLLVGSSLAHTATTSTAPRAGRMSAAFDSRHYS